MTPLFVENLKAPSYLVKGVYVNALYKKVEKDNFYMIGDNRDNSSDSRFWGSVSYDLIVGKPWLIYMSLEHRSYDKVLNGDKNGNGKDNAILKRHCKDMDISSAKCENIWNKYRFNIRWGRVARRAETLQLENPIE